MLKKNLPLKVYLLTSVLMVTMIGYYFFLLHKDTKDSFNQDSKLAQISADQSRMTQQIMKNALGMDYSKNEKQYNYFRRELRDVYSLWQKGHAALINGDLEMNIFKPSQTDDYLKLQEGIKFYFININSYLSSILEIPFAQVHVDADINSTVLKKTIKQLVDNIKGYQTSTINILNYFFKNTNNGKNSVGIVEYIVFFLFFLLLIVQGVFTVRPLAKLPSDNYLSAFKAYDKVKISEQHLKINFQKQKLINKKLFQSKMDLEEKNSKLKESESKLLKSSEDQIKINERLISTQEELNLAYEKLKNSEKGFRELVDKQLKDNEKLFFAEKSLKLILENEKKLKNELADEMDFLKNTQTQLVHSEKMASLGQLTAGIAHEINNSINFISSGMVSLKISIESMREIVEEYTRIDNGDDINEVIESVKNLKKEHEYDEIVDELDDLVNDINYGVQQTIEIVKGLRVFSRLDEEDAKNANINDNIDATLILLRNITKGKIEIIKHYDEGMKEIECYPGRLNQVFMNILNNALQAMPKEKKDGQITIYTEEEKDMVSVRIKDNGVGIPDEIKNKIWEPFFTTKEVGVGTGLGMSITYDIIEKHGGKIELESEVGEGTEFIISLPKKILEIKNAEVEVS